MNLPPRGGELPEPADAALRKLVNDNAPILEHLSEGVILAGTDGKLLFVNRAAEQIHGVKALDVAPDDYSETYHLCTLDGAPYPFADLPLARAVANGETVIDARWRIHRPDGTDAVAIGSARPLVEDGRQIGAILNLRDDTERYGAERQLRLSEERNRLILDAATDYAIFTTDPQRIITGWSKGAAAVFGYPANDAVGMSGDVLWTPEDRATGQPIREVETARATGCANDERWHMRADGSRAFLNGSVHPLPRDEQGRERGFIKIARDETEVRAVGEALRESEARFRNMADHAPVMMWVTEADGRCSYLNRSWYEFTGQTEAEALGFGWLGAVHPDDVAEAERAFVEANAKAAPFRVEYRLRRADGTYRWAIDAASPRFGGAGEYLGYVGSVVDIDDRKQAEEALRAKAAEFEALAENVSQLAWMAGPDGAIFWYNRRWYEYTGTSPDTQEGWGWESVHDPAVLPAVVAAWTTALNSGTDFEMTFPLRGADGSFRPFLTRAVPIRDESGQIGRWFGTNTDVTLQHEADERRRFTLALADRLRSLSDPREIVAAAVEVLGRQLGVSRVGYGEFSADGTMLTFETDYGDGVEHLVGTFPVENFGRGNIAALARGETTVYPDLQADPRTRDADWSVIATRAAMAVPLIRDERLTALLYCNHRDVREWQPEEVALVQDVAARTWDALERARAEAALHLLNTNLEARVLERGAELERAQEALRQSQKMETLGQLTGGIAHDFNNLLQIITGNLDILRRAMPADSPRLQRSVDNAFKGAERAAVLTQRLLAFSRRQPLVPKVISANKLVAGMSELLHRAIGETVAIETVLASGLWRVEADTNQLETALLNLAINSRDAMPEGGKLTIETANTHLDRLYADHNSGVVPGQYVVICVSDTGAGMDAATAGRAVDPFFTTKEVGKGTGLGLSMVYGFVKQSGGHLKIYSEVSEGTTIKIYLPRHHGEEVEIEETVDSVPAPTGVDGETILVCEDDEDVRAYSVQSLRELGYRVLEAADGKAALRMLESASDSIDLLFTDIVLPGGMTGAMVAESAREIKPDLKVLFTTGYARNAIVHHGRLDPGVELLSKPFSYADLAARVRYLLDAPTGRSSHGDAGSDGAPGPTRTDTP